MGFEPTVGIHPQRFSRPSHSAALAPFRLATLSVGVTCNPQSGETKLHQSQQAAIATWTRCGGGGGIRTHGSLRFTRFPSAPIRPLSHPSESSSRATASRERRQAIAEHATESLQRDVRVPKSAMALACGTTSPRRVRWRSGPVQRTPENQVRSGRKQPSSEVLVCRRSPGRHFSRRGFNRLIFSQRCSRRARQVVELPTHA